MTSTIDADREMSPREMRDLTRFLEDIRKGVGPLNAAIAIGWSPAKLRSLQKQEWFAELVAIAEERQLETIEQTLTEMAAAGHFRAIQMVLFNKKPSNWRDIKHIQVDQQVALDVGVVVSVKQAALEMLRERGITEMQPVIDVPSIEVVRDQGD